jgi:hypothetical protein
MTYLVFESLDQNTQSLISILIITGLLFLAITNLVIRFKEKK